MSYPPSPHPSQAPYTPPGGNGAPGQHNLGLIGGIVIGCTVLLLGSILLVAFVVNRGDDAEPGTSVADDAETSDEAEEVATEPDDGGDSPAGGDPEEVAIAVAGILYGISDESAESLLCSDPGANLQDPNSTGETVRETLGEEYIDLIDELVATDSYEDGDLWQVEVSFVIYGVETEAGTVELVAEDGQWKACDFTY